MAAAREARTVGHSHGAFGFEGTDSVHLMFCADYRTRYGVLN